MSDQKMQECFEFFYDLKWEQVNDFAQQAWKAAWLASRETMVIELPHFVGAFPKTQDYVRSECKKAIEAAGVRVKS